MKIQLPEAVVAAEQTAALLSSSTFRTAQSQIGRILGSGVLVQSFNFSLQKWGKDDELTAAVRSLLEVLVHARDQPKREHGVAIRAMCQTVRRHLGRIGVEPSRPWNGPETQGVIAARYGVQERTVRRWAKGESKGKVEVKKEGSGFYTRPWSE